MRAYSTPDEEALLAHNLLKDWAGEGLLNSEQYKHLKQETVCELRQTNIFLRVVLFLFTLLIVGAAVGLYFLLFLQHAASQQTGIALLIFAAISYGSMELAVSQARLYRHGIEEALAVVTISFLCVGVLLASNAFSMKSPATECFAFSIGSVVSLWLWFRFGLPYAFLSAMIFFLFLPAYWTTSIPARHLILASSYTASLLALVTIRPHQRDTHLNHQYSIAEALLWLGIYLAINLQIWSLNRTTSEIPTYFYWATWALTWCLPPVILRRGLRTKDRFVIAAGILSALLTLITNRLYLGRPSHTWDPMILGVLLMGTALLVRRWLSAAPDGIRHGFTARSLSATDKSWLNTTTAALSLGTPHNTTPSPQPTSQFGGGDSGGAGASSDF